MSLKKYLSKFKSFGWDQYNKLSTEKKEEYVFKFGSGTYQPQFSSLFLIILLFKAQFTVMIFALYLISKEPVLESLKYTLPVLTEYVFLVLKIEVLVIIAYLLYDLIMAIYSSTKKSRWIKRNAN